MPIKPGSQKISLLKLFDIWISQGGSTNEFTNIMSNSTINRVVSNEFQRQIMVLPIDIPRPHQQRVMNILGVHATGGNYTVSGGGSTLGATITGSSTTGKLDALFHLATEFDASGRTERRANNADLRHIVSTLREAGNLVDALEPNSYLVARNKLLRNLDRVQIDFGTLDTRELEEKTILLLGVLGIDLQLSRMDVPESAIYSRTVTTKQQEAGIPVYTGVDMRIFAITPTIITELILCKTISYSSHAGLSPVKVLGRTGPKGYAVGDRTYAGTIICELGINDPLLDLHPEWTDPDANKYFTNLQDLWKPLLYTDQIPTFDLIITFQNEYGSQSAFSIFGVKIPDTGQVMSMNDASIEISYTYVALDVDLIREIRAESVNGEIRAIDILGNNQYIAARQRVMKGYSIHQGPFDAYALYNRVRQTYQELDFVENRINRVSLSEYARSRGLIQPTELGAVRVMPPATPATILRPDGEIASQGTLP